MENVPTERKTICNIERATDTGTTDSENEVSNDDGNSFNKEYEINVESNDTNSAGTSGTVMVSAQTCTTEVNIKETADDEERNKKAKKSTGGVLKKKKQSQNSTMQAALLQYWKERDTERRSQIQGLQPTLNQEQDPDVDGIKSFCSHVGVMLKKLTPTLRVEAKTKVFTLLADYELRSLNLTTTMPLCSSTSFSSPLFDQNSQFSSTNSYSPISTISSPTSFVQATDPHTFNSSTNMSENISRDCQDPNATTYYDLSEENNYYSYEKI